MAEFNSESFNENLTRHFIEQAEIILTPAEFGQVKILKDDHGRISFDGPKEIVEKLYRGLKIEK